MWPLHQLDYQLVYDYEILYFCYRSGRNTVIMHQLINTSGIALTTAVLSHYAGKMKHVHPVILASNYTSFVEAEIEHISDQLQLC